MPLDPFLRLADCDAWDPGVFESQLSTDERSRADRFRFRGDRDRFVVRRGLLRRLLAARLGIGPAAVPLRAGPHGKPLLDAAHVLGRSLDRAPVFNLSRSRGMVLYAMADATEVASIGVDLERVDADRRTLDDLLRVADRFAPLERRFLGRLPATEATGAFYRLWTCKEACLKNLGTGIGGAEAPDLSEVALEIDAGGSVHRARWERGGLEWRLACFEPCAGHTAAVALPAGAGRGVDGWNGAIAWLPLEPDANERRLSPAGEPPPGPGPAGP